MYCLIVVGHSEGTTLKRSGSVESLVSQNQRTSETGDSEVRQSHADSRAKRSTSLKKVANRNPHPSVETHPAYPGLPNANCGMWNESFRVAVDRSYGNQVLSGTLTNYKFVNRFYMKGMN